MSGRRGPSGLSILLIIIMIVELAIIGFKYPGVLVSDRGGQQTIAGQQPPGGAGQQPPGGQQNEANAEGMSSAEGADAANSFAWTPDFTYEEVSAEVEEALSGLPEEQKREMAPGSPANISLSVNREEIEAVEPLTAVVSPENPVCTVGEITVDFKWWNLDGEETLQVRPMGTRTDGESGSTLQLYDFSLASGKDHFATDVEITMPRPQDGRANGVVWYDPESDSWHPTSYDISEDGKNYILYTDHFSLFGPEASDYVTPEMLSSDIGRGLFCTGFTAEERSHISNTELWNRPLVVSDERLTRLYQNALDNQEFLRELIAAGNIHPEATLKGGTVEAFGSKYGTADKWQSTLGAVKNTGRLGKGFLGFSSLFLALKMGYQYGYKSEPVANLLKEYKYDLGAVAVGLIALFLPEAGLAAGVASVGSALLSWGQDIEDFFTYDSSYYSLAYQYFLDDATYAKVFEELRNRRGVSMKVDGTGWAEELSGLAEDVAAGKFDSRKNAQGYVPFDDLVRERFDRYLNCFWEQNEAVRSGAGYDYIESEYKSVSEEERASMHRTFVWNEKTAQERKSELQKSMRARLEKNTREIVYGIYKKYINDMVVDYKEEMQSTSLVFLNSTVVIEAKDAALSPGESFGSNSAYAENPDTIVFDGITDKPVYWPADMTDNDYYRGKFHPYCLEGEDEIFSCRMYYYMMYGSPEKLRFRGNSDTGLSDSTPTFHVPEDDLGRIIVEVPVNGTQQKKKEKTASGTYRILPVEEEKRHSYGGGSNYQYALSKAFENAVLTLNADGTFSGSGEWSESYGDNSRETSAYSEEYLFTTDRKEDISASITFKGRVGTGGEDGTFTFSATISQMGDNKEVEYMPENILDIRMVNTVTDTWQYEHSLSGEGSVSWTSETRPGQEKSERCLMLNGHYDGTCRGESKHTRDEENHGKNADLTKDQHLSETKPENREISYGSAFYIYYPE